jgi:hypothetical protein
MLGSGRRHFHHRATTRSELFSVRIFGQTFWGWVRRNERGEVLACAEHLFPDYVACLCDAHGRS